MLIYSPFMCIGMDSQYKSKLHDYYKIMICNKIFRHKTVIQPDDEEYDYKTKLKTHYQSIFEVLFKEEEVKGIMSRLGIRKRSRYKYTYDNSSKFRKFLVNGVIREENTFACVIRNSDETFDLYYISDYRYNLNEVQGGEKLFGRFLFFNDQIYALAEELPEFYSFPKNWDLKTDYIEKRKGYGIGTDDAFF